MSKYPRIGVAVADGARALILATTDRHNFELIDTMASDDAHVRTHDLVSDRPGRSIESHGGAHHAIEARHDPHELEKQAFLRSVADRLGRAATAFDRVVIVAPPHQLGQLRTYLDEPLRRKVTEEVGKDWLKLPSAELYERIAALLQPH
ncbi:MAG: host attachment protein [Alphaproteobacteria bacterium]|nr:host attachment protein [Alphaproteobacteria bacterium]